MDYTVHNSIRHSVDRPARRELPIPATDSATPTDHPRRPRYTSTPPIYTRISPYRPSKSYDQPPVAVSRPSSANTSLRGCKDTSLPILQATQHARAARSPRCTRVSRRYHMAAPPLVESLATGSGSLIAALTWMKIEMSGQSL